jgi:two-component system chemotaxis response regulator CheY
MRNSHFRFLIVDDFGTARRIIGKLLREIGFAESDEAADGQEALDMLRRDRYDCVITDIEMPRLDGFELVAAMRRDPALEQIPALLATREPSKEQVVRASKVRANGYVVHPLTRTVLEDRIRAILCLPPSAFPRRGTVDRIAPIARR